MILGDCSFTSLDRMTPRGGKGGQNKQRGAAPLGRSRRREMKMWREKPRVGSAHDHWRQRDKVKERGGRTMREKEVWVSGQPPGVALMRGDVPEAPRPISHKVVWDHSSSRGIGLTSLGEVRRRGLAGDRGGWCRSQSVGPGTHKKHRFQAAAAASTSSSFS